jgi:hypothetical protein
VCSVDPSSSDNYTHNKRRKKWKRILLLLFCVLCWVIFYCSDSTRNI